MDYYFFMNKICPKCHFLGKGKQSILNNLYVGAAVIIMGLSIYINDSYASLTVSRLFNILVAVPIIYIGIRIILSHFSGNSTCPNCGQKPMLSLDEAEAIEIIKGNDIKTAKEKAKESSPQST